MPARLLAAVVLALLAVAAPAVAQSPRPLLPDLSSMPAENPILQEEFDVALGGDEDRRRLLRFDGFIHNSGEGPLELRGSSRVELTMGSVVQRLKWSNATWTEQPTPAKIGFEDVDGHNHWHLDRIARYSLVGQDGAAEVAPSQKVGFCLEDSQRVSGNQRAIYGHDGDRGEIQHDFCAEDNPSVPDLTMGVSAGWRDRYHAHLWFQWVDVSNVAPGPYRLRSETDPGNVVHEADELNPPAFKDVVVSGHTARPQTVTGSGGEPLTFALGSTPHAAAGETLQAPRYRLERLPAHGELLDRDGRPLTLGQTFDAPALRYEPGAGAPPTDELSFSVREGDSRFPLSAPQATVALRAGSPAPEPPAPVRQVTLSGAQDLVAGTSMQLTPQVQSGDAADLVWEATTGDVGPAGLYRAPGTVPAGGRASVTARLPTGEEARVSFAILPVPARLPAPSPPATPDILPAVPASVLPPAVPPQPSADPGPAAVPVPPVPHLRVRAILARKAISASVVSRYDGRLRISLMTGSRKVSACSARSRAKRSYLCRLPVRGVRASKLRVVAALRRTNGRLITRTSRLPRGRAVNRPSAVRSGHGGHAHG